MCSNDKAFIYSSDGTTAKVHKLAAKFSLIHSRQHVYIIRKFLFSHSRVSRNLCQGLQSGVELSGGTSLAFMAFNGKVKIHENKRTFVAWKKIVFFLRYKSVIWDWMRRSVSLLQTAIHFELSSQFVTRFFIDSNLLAGRWERREGVIIGSIDSWSSSVSSINFAFSRQSIDLIDGPPQGNELNENLDSIWWTFFFHM